MANILDELLSANVDILSIAQRIAPNGRIIGNEYKAICPFHQDKNPSYSINLKTGLSYCFGCGHSGDIVSDYAEIKNISLSNAKKELLGIAPKEKKPQQNGKANTNEQLEKAKYIWNKSIYDDKTLSKYFRSRGLKPKKYDTIKVYHGTEAELYQNNKDIPITAMVSKITDAYNNFKSIHITELTEEKGKIVRKQKRFFKGLSIAGSFVAFGDISKTQTVAVAEGIETALSIKEALPNLCVLASLSASFMPSIILPSNVKNIYIFADNDNAGTNAGKQLEARLKQENKKVYLVSSKKEGNDFNDVLKEQGIDGILEAFNNKKETKETPKFSVLKGFSPRPITNFLKDNYNFFVDKSKTLWLYDTTNGIWQKDAEPIVESILRTEVLAEELAKKYVISEVLADLKGSLYIPQNLPEADIHLIPFSNGVYDFTTNELIPFSPEQFLTYKLPVQYNPEAKCEKIQAFLEEIGNSEELLEIVGYTLYRKYPYQKIFFLYGTGGNGKSTFLSILATFLGKQNISAQTLESLINNRFSVAELHNKLANISSDEKIKSITNSAVIKMLTGGDLISAEQKNKNPFIFENFAKLIVSTNKLPMSEDKTDAFFRRIHLIKFSKKFERDKDKKNIVNTLTTKENLEGLGILAIQHLKKLIKKNFKFTNETTANQIADYYEKLSNPVENFVETFTMFSPNSFEFVTKSDFKKMLNIWLTNNKIAAMTEKQITQEMRRLGYKDGLAKQNSKIVRVWKTVKFIDDVIRQVITENEFNKLRIINSELPKIQIKETNNDEDEIPFF